MPKQRLLAGAIVVLCGCGGNPSSTITVPPTSPTAHPPSPRPVAETWTAQGLVFHTSYEVCRDCVVEVVDGPRAGTTTVTDSRGHFLVAVPNESPQVTLRATRDGYRSVKDEIATRGSLNSGWVALHVASLLPPAPLRGPYRMKLEPDPNACTSFPPSLRAREYDIVLNRNASLPEFRFQAESVGGATERFEMYVGVSGNDVGVNIWHPDDESAGIIERLDADTGESVSVFAWTASSAPYARPLTMSLSGTVTWCPTRAGASCVVCESSSHRLALVPR